jgi:hypothetical protein
MTDAVSETPQVETRRLEQALDAQLYAIDQHDEWCDRAGVRPKLKAVSLEELIATELSPAEELLTRPVCAARRHLYLPTPGPKQPHR